MENKKWYDGAVMLNRDPNWYNRIDDSSGKNCCKALEEYFATYSCSKNITDIVLCVFEQTSITPSKYVTWRGAKAHYTLEDGVPVNEAEYKSRLTKLYNCYMKYGVDPVQIFIDQMNKIGKRPWLSLRMNDVHHGTNPTSFLRSDMYYEARKAGEMIGDAYGYYKTALNFKHARVREALLGYAGELLEKYDIFGFELDFMREIYCFDYKNDTGIQEIMLDYIRQIRKLVDAAAERLGHPVMLSIRTSRSPLDAYQFGFDIKTMVDEGLIDVVITTPRWCPTDSGIPVEEWKKLVGDKAAIIAGIEFLNLKMSRNEPAQAKAYAAAFFAGGADGLYYNNHEYASERNDIIWNINRENCTDGKREFVVTCQDIAAYPENQYKPLPIVLEGDTKELALKIGKVKASDKVSVIIDFEGDMAPTLSLGNTKDAAGVPTEHISGLKHETDPIVITAHSPYIYDIGGFECENDVTLTFSGTGAVHYVNIVIEAQ